MKKLSLATILVFSAGLSIPLLSRAQGPGNAGTTGNNPNNMGSDSSVNPGSGTIVNKTAKTPTKVRTTISKKKDSRKEADASKPLNDVTTEKNSNQE
jgi:hypothetical protein